MPKKKDKQEDTSLKTILIVLGLLIVFYCGGYFVGVRLISREPGEEKIVISSKNKEVEYSTTDDMIVHLMERLMVGMDCWNVEVFTNDKTITPTDLEDSKIFEIVSFSSFYATSTNLFTYDDFMEESKKYFEGEVSFDPLKVDYSSKSCLPYTYDKDNKMFMEQKTACGGSCGPNRSQYKIVSAIEKDSILRVSVRVLFGSQAEDVKFYSDYNRTNFVTDDYENLEDYFHEGDNYLFTFKKVDGYYVFSSSEKM